MTKRFIYRSIYILTLVAATFLMVDFAISYLYQQVLGFFPSFFSYDNPMFVSLGITDQQVMADILNGVVYAIIFAIQVLASLLFSFLWNIGTSTRKTDEEKAALRKPLVVLLTILGFLVLFGLMFVTTTSVLITAQFLLMALYWEYRWGGGHIVDRAKAVGEEATTQPAELEPVAEELKLFPDEAYVVANTEEADAEPPAESASTEAKQDAKPGEEGNDVE